MAGFMLIPKTGDIELHIGDNQFDECTITIPKGVAKELKEFLNTLEL